MPDGHLAMIRISRLVSKPLDLKDGGDHESRDHEERQDGQKRAFPDARVHPNHQDQREGWKPKRDRSKDEYWAGWHIRCMGRLRGIPVDPLLPDFDLRRGVSETTWSSLDICDPLFDGAWLHSDGPLEN